MSVPKSKRTLSDMQFFHNALQLHKELTLLFISNFKIKEINKLNIDDILPNSTEQEKIEFRNLMQQFKIDIQDISNKVPIWYLKNKRDMMFHLLDSLINYIIGANSIYPTSKVEFDERRLLQDKAIANCYTLLTQFQLIIYDLQDNIKIDKYQKYINMINDEIYLLKGWRTSTNKFLKSISKNEAEYNKYIQNEYNRLLFK